MLTSTITVKLNGNSCEARATKGSSQRGIVLFITLIVLVAMTLAGIALVRSVSTTNIIAGNLAFQQGATHGGDTGIETAVTWLEVNSAGATLQSSNNAQGYRASRQDPAAGQTWDNFWTNNLVGAGQVVTLAPDAAGNTISYVIHRMCTPSIPEPFDSTAVGANCATSPSSTAGSGSSKGSGAISLQYSSGTYYRVTTRISGPRNTVSFVQAIVAM